MIPKLRLLASFAFSVSALAASASVVHAQSFVEFAAGSNWVHPRSDRQGFSYGHGFTGRASYGQTLTPAFSIRLDADFAQFDDAIQYYPPCAPPGCTRTYYYTETNFLAGMTVNALANLDRNGRLYVVGGGGPAFGDLGTREWQAQISAGAGVSLPSGDRFHLVVEARWLGLIGGGPNATWLVPFTVGIRY